MMIRNFLHSPFNLKFNRKTKKSDFREFVYIGNNILQTHGEISQLKLQKRKL